METRKKWQFALILVVILIILSLSGCMDPIDDPELPDRGFFMGILPNPADGQDFSESYELAAEYSEFFLFGPLEPELKVSGIMPKSLMDGGGTFF